MEIKSKLLGPTPKTLRALAPQPALNKLPRSHSEALQPGLPLPSCVTPGTWANISGPQLPLL